MVASQPGTPPQGKQVSQQRPWGPRPGALEKYLERRAYDPEGLCWCGRTIAKLGHNETERSAFEQPSMPVRTMAPSRRRQLRSWEARMPPAI